MQMLTGLRLLLDLVSDFLAEPLEVLDADLTVAGDFDLEQEGDFELDLLLYEANVSLR